METSWLFGIDTIVATLAQGIDAGLALVMVAAARDTKLEPALAVASADQTLTLSDDVPRELYYFIK